jgi:predicted nuclease with TOPRIM domain
LFWDYLSGKTKDLIKKNLDNRIIQDMLNQYTAISNMSCTKAAQNYLTCKSTLEKFIKGRNALRAFLDELKNSPV